jgi:hypothetical protein
LEKAEKAAEELQEMRKIPGNLTLCHGNWSLFIGTSFIIGPFSIAFPLNYHRL